MSRRVKWAIAMLAATPVFVAVAIQLAYMTDRVPGVVALLSAMGLLLGVAGFVLLMIEADQ